MSHVRRGDVVVVTKGKDKGKRGKVLRVVGDRLVIEKVNMIKRHSKPTQKNPQGGIVEKEGTIHGSTCPTSSCSTTSSVAAPAPRPSSRRTAPRSASA
jgi:ribosomal protein L24